MSRKGDEKTCYDDCSCEEEEKEARRKESVIYMREGGCFRKMVMEEEKEEINSPLPPIPSKKEKKGKKGNKFRLKKAIYLQTGWHAERKEQNFRTLSGIPPRNLGGFFFPQK